MDVLYAVAREARRLLTPPGCKSAVVPTPPEGWAILLEVPWNNQIAPWALVRFQDGRARVGMAMQNWTIPHDYERRKKYFPVFERQFELSDPEVFERLYEEVLGCLPGFRGGNEDAPPPGEVPGGGAWDLF